MHFILTVLLILFSSNLWSLTFKDGKQVNEDNQNEIKIPKEVPANNFQIQNPGVIFISKDKFLNDIITYSENLNWACKTNRTKPLTEIPLPTKTIKHSEWNNYEVYMNTEVTNYFRSYCGYLINGGDFQNYKDNLLDIINKGGLKNMPNPGDNDDFPYSYSINLVPILLYYSFSQELFNTQEREIVRNWLESLTLKYDNIFDRPNNHRLYYLNYLLAHSIVFNDERLFNHSIKLFKSTMNEEWTKEGLLKTESERGSCALHYNYHSLNPIFGFIFNAKMQGLDLFSEPISKDFTIRDIVDSIYKATLNTDMLKKYSKTNRAGDTCLDNKGFSHTNSRNPEYIYTNLSSHQNAWLLFYESQYGHEAIERYKLLELPERSGFQMYATAKLVNGFSNSSLGGIPCLFFLEDNPMICK